MRKVSEAEELARRAALVHKTLVFVIVIKSLVMMLMVRMTMMMMNDDEQKRIKPVDRSRIC